MYVGLHGVVAGYGLKRPASGVAECRLAGVWNLQHGPASRVPKSTYRPTWVRQRKRKIAQGEGGLCRRLQTAGRQHEL